MTVRLRDITLYEGFCADPTAENFASFADGALPVYLEEGDDGEPILRTAPGCLDPPYGRLFVLYEGELEKRIVVRY